MRAITRTRRAGTTAAVGAGLVLVLGACGGGDETDGSEDTGDAVGETSGAAGGTDTGTDESGVAGGDSDTATATQPPGPAAKEVASAQEGLGGWLAENKPETPSTTFTIPGCPAISVEQMEEAFAVAGYPDTTLGSWGTEIEWSEYEALHPDLMGIACGGDSDGDANDSDFGTAGGVLAVDLAGKSDFESFLAAADLTDSKTVEPPKDLGGDLRTHCFDDGPDFCVALWHEDGLVLGASLIADGADQKAAQSLLEEVLPDLLDGLAEA